ncbi:MAG: hypothetical protein HYW47_02470 [Deltaproteobacteria bacterium]|nr:hypothetical protein [Deltaproteobacteria bacterium]
MKVLKGIFFFIFLTTYLTASPGLGQNKPTEPHEPPELVLPNYKTDDNKYRYFEFPDFIHEIDWQDDKNETLIGILTVLPKTVESLFYDTYLYRLGFYEVNYTRKNYELRERIARSYPGRENDIEFLIEEIISENAWDALYLGFIAGGTSEAILARFGKSAELMKNKYGTLRSLLGRTFLFASMDSLITSHCFINAYFQIANLLGWTKGDKITRNDARKFFFQTVLYGISVYGIDVTAALTLQTLGKKLLHSMAKKSLQYVTQEEMTKLGQGFRFFLNMAFSKTHWREFWGMLLRTVGMNNGSKKAFWLACAQNKSGVSMGASPFAALLGSKSTIIFHVLTQGAISAAVSYNSVKYSLNLFMNFLHPPLKATPQLGANDFKKLLDNNILFKIVVNTILKNTASVQGSYSENNRDSPLEAFALLAQELYGMPYDSFKDSPHFKPYLTRLQTGEPFTLSEEEKNLYFDTSMEAKLITYLICFYFLAYDGFSIEDSHLLQKVTLMGDMLEDRKISHNEIQLMMIRQSELASFLDQERRQFAESPVQYLQTNNTPYPELKVFYDFSKVYLVTFYNGDHLSIPNLDNLFPYHPPQESPRDETPEAHPPENENK